jgi:cobalt-zinc-cadmium efflux system outer membrane protein
MPAKSLYRLASGLAALTAALALAVAPAPAAPITEAEAIEHALAQPEFTALGEANRDEARARVSGIRSLDNPEATVSRESVSGGGRSETEWQVGVVQPIDLSGKRSRLRAAARAEVGAIEAETARRRQARVAEVRRAYSACAAGGERLRVLHGFAERLREAERIVAARADAGDAAVYDLRRLRVEARAAEAETLVQMGESTAGCATLSALTGVDQAQTAASLTLLASGVSSPPAGATRPDLMAREQRLAAAADRVRAAQRARLPDLLVGVGLKRVSGDGGSAMGPVASIGMRVPIFDSGRATVAEAQARLRAQQAELALARQEAGAVVAAAEARSEAAAAALERIQQAAEDARRLGPIAEAAYEGGEGNVVELVDAYRAARDAELNIVQQLERVIQTRIELDLARGTL